MYRKIVELDCSKYPEIIGSSLKLKGQEKDVIKTALRIAMDTNGHQNTLELRKQIKALINKKR